MSCSWATAWPTSRSRRWAVARRSKPPKSRTWIASRARASAIHVRLLIHVADGRIVTHSAGNITTPEAAALIAALRAGLRFDGVEFHPGVSYRHVLKLTRPASKAIECFAPHDHLDEPMAGWMPRATAPEGEATAHLLREIIEQSHGILRDHPVNQDRARRGLQTANFCWPWSIGRRPRMKAFEELYGLRGAVVAAVDLIRGLGVCAGMFAPAIKGATGLWDTDYEAKADAALRLLEDHDLVYVHVEAADEASHEGSADLKRRCIEDLDRRLIARVLDRLPQPARVAVLPDHPTPIRIRTHAATPVPFAMMGPGIEPDAVASYSESACAQGRYPNLAGADFMRLFTGVVTP